MEVLQKWTNIALQYTRAMAATIEVDSKAHEA